MVNTETVRPLPTWVRWLSLIIVIVCTAMLVLQVFRFFRGQAHWFELLPLSGLAVVSLANLLEGWKKHVATFTGILILIGAIMTISLHFM